MKCDIVLIDERIKTAVLKNLDGILDDKLFRQTLDSFEEQKNELIVRLSNLSAIVPEFKTYLSNSSSLLVHLGEFYNEVSSENQKKLIGSIFPEKIYFEDNFYRTTKINEAVGLVFNLGAGFNKNSPEGNSRLSSVAPPAGLEPATL